MTKQQCLTAGLRNGRQVGMGERKKVGYLKFGFLFSLKAAMPSL